MNILKRKNRKGDRIMFYYDFGRKAGQRPSTGIFIYTKPKDQAQKNHNKEALALIEVKKSQVIIENQSIGTAYIPNHKFKANFLEYYEDYVKKYCREGNRHLENSLIQFRKFIDSDFLSPKDITENLCKRFRQYLLDKFNGETPQNYYARFKWAVNAATKDGYFTQNPTETVSAKANPSYRLKDNLEAEEYNRMLNTPCSNQEVKAAFIFSLYTGLRWVDAKKLCWDDLNGTTMITRMIQAKTGQPVTITLHPIAEVIIQQQREKYAAGGYKNQLVFQLPSANGCNKMLKLWIVSAGIEKYITWSCARLSFSILLQDKNVDTATVAYFMGHTTTYQVSKTYKRYRPKDQFQTIGLLPTPARVPEYLN